MPGIGQRPTKLEFLKRAGQMLARLAMGVLDGNRRGSRFPPSATNCATYFGNAVGPAATDPLGEQYSATPGQGFSVEDLFASAAAQLEPELVMAGHELLGEYYLRCKADIETAGADADVPKIVARVLVRDADPLEIDDSGFSLWILFLQECYADSPYLALALRHDKHVEPTANPFAPWQKIPGVY